MIPDLGKYAVEVSLAYGVSIALLALIIVLSWTKSRKVHQALQDAEARKDA